MSREDEPWVLHKIIPVGGVSVLFGNPKAGKSFAAIQLACAVAGELPDWLGIPVQHHGPVLYVQIDMARGDWLARYVDPAVAAGYNIENLYFEDRKTIPYPFNILGPGGPFLATSVKSMVIPPVLVIIDTYRDVHAGDENDSMVIRNVITTLRGVVGDAAVLLLHHARKMLADQVGDIIQDLRGSSALSGSMDGFIRLYSPENSGKGTLTYKSRAVDQLSLSLKRLPNGYWTTDHHDEFQVIRELAKQHQGLTLDALDKIIAARFGWSQSTARSRRIEATV